MARAVVADRGHAPGPLRLCAGTFEHVLAGPVCAVGRGVVAVLWLGHEPVLGERGGDPGMSEMAHVGGAVHDAGGRAVRPGPRVAGRVSAAAVDRLRTQGAAAWIAAEEIGLAARVVMRAHRVVIAGHGKELDAVARGVIVEDAHEPAHVHRLAVVGEIAGQRDQAHPARHGIVERGEEGEGVLVEQACRGQLRLHRAYRRPAAGTRIEHAVEGAGLERGVDIVEMHVGHERDAHRRLRPGRTPGRTRCLGRVRAGARQQSAQQQCGRQRTSPDRATRRRAPARGPPAGRAALPGISHAQKSARRPRLMRRPDSSYIVGNDGSIV